MKDKIKKITSIIKSIPCFSFLDLDKLALVIQSLAIRKKKKSDIIFNQGDKTTSFYLLTEGEIKISK
jgi:CRP-like cAMP-binding protein